MFRNFFKPKTPVPKQRTVEELIAAATGAYEARDLAQAVTLHEQLLALRPADAEAQYRCANALKDLGRFEAALERYDQAVLHHPDFAHAWCNRGVVLQDLGRHAAALESYDRAIALEPADAVAHANRGALLQSLSRWEAALESYDRALSLHRQSPQTWFHRGNVLRELGRLDAAAASYQEAVELQPDRPEAHYNLAVLLERTGQPRAAVTSYDRAIAIRPDFHQAHFNRAGVLESLTDWPAALDGYERAIAVRGDYAEAFSNRGVVLQALGRWPDARASYDRAIDLKPDQASGYFNRGNLSTTQRQWAAALADYDRATALAPDMAQAHCERGRVLRELKRPVEALAAFTRAVELKPEFAEARFNRSLSLLSTGDFANGWREHEWRWKNAERLSLVEQRPRPHSLWCGDESLVNKTILLHWEQGLGDTLQFCRFATTVAARGATVILEVQRSLVTLLECLPRVAHVIADGGVPPAVDFRCPLLSLPWALGTTIDTIPAASGYLRADPAVAARWRQRLGRPTRPRIGLAWSGNSMNANDRNRSCCLADWTSRLPAELEYVCLQNEIRPADRETLAADPRIAAYDDELSDFGNTAALCECMDLVISVDTSLAHLSGALGRPTWVLLPFNPDWRWLLERRDSPWYSSATLYRQRTLGDWNGMLEQVAQDLRTEFGLAAVRGV